MRHWNNSLDTRNIMADWNESTPLCTTDSITLGGAPDVAAAPVLPPSNPSYTFSRFLLITSYSFFFHKYWALMLFSDLFLIFHFLLLFSFVSFFLSECIFLFRAFIFGNHKIDWNYIFNTFDTLNIYIYIYENIYYYLYIIYNIWHICFQQILII